MFVFLPTVHCMCTCHSVLSHLGSLGKNIQYFLFLVKLFFRVLVDLEGKGVCY